MKISNFRRHMADLSVKFGGLTFPRPVGVSSLAPVNSFDPEKLARTYEKHVEAGAGWVITGYTSDEMVHPPEKKPTYRFMRAESMGFGVHGLYGVADIGRIITRLDTSRKIVNLLKQKELDVPIISSIMPPSGSIERWVKLAQTVVSFGYDAIELNIACPLSTAEVGGVDQFMKKNLPEITGVMFGDVLEAVQSMAKEVVKSVSVPVGCKLDPQTGYPRFVALASALKECGIKWVTTISSPFTVVPPDIVNIGKPLWPMLDDNVPGAATGPWDKYLMQRDVAGIASFVPGLDIMGVGGIMDPTHVVETMMLGAKAVAYSTGLIWNGRSVLRRSIEFLSDYLDHHGLTLAELSGLGLKYISAPELVDWKTDKLVAKIDGSACSGCGICADNICTALYMKDGVADLVESDCTACTMCVAICPENAITIVDRKSGELVYKRSSSQDRFALSPKLWPKIEIPKV